MYLSKWELEYPPRFLRRGNVVEYHRAVMALFPSVEASNPRSEMEILWRRDADQYGGDVLLIQSNTEPSLEHVKSEALARNRKLITREIESLNRSLIERGNFSYRIRLNPVKREGNKRHPITATGEIEQWWIQLLAKAGATADPEKLIVSKESITRGHYASSGDKFSINSASIVGRATTEDVNALLERIRLGFGKEKSFGFGLMSIGS